MQSKQNQRKFERLVLIIYSFYNVSLCVGAIRNQWAFWIPLCMLTVTITSWIVYFIKYKNFRIRASFTTIMVEISFILYSIHMKNLLTIIPTFMVLTILVAFYGQKENIWITLIGLLLVLFYHGIITDSFLSLDRESLFSLLPQIGNIFFLEFIIYLWLKYQEENNEQIYKIVEALIEAEQSKDDFLSNVSHEIRTPVNTICGMSEMALRESNPDKIREEIFDIRDAGHNLMVLVSDILDFSQLQQGKMNIEEEAYNITSTINDIINMAMARKGDKQIELIVDCDPNIPCDLFGDEKKIRRIMINLLDNAIKFTNEGGILMEIHTRREIYGVNLCISIKDTGIGISEDSLEKLFESFSQVDTRRNRHRGGVGLGLAISRELVRKMGGTITVRSRLGKGSIFRFVIPQKILNEKPIVQIENKERLNIAAYFDMEQFNMITVRDEYTNLITHMIQKLQVKCHICRNLAELKRRNHLLTFTHIFISLEEYKEDMNYFDELSEHRKVIVTIDAINEKYIPNPNIIKLYKPFYILPVASILNGNNGSESGKQLVRSGKFIAPEAHILVVDDNRMNIRVIEGLLKEYQISVTYATSGIESLDMIESMSYDFIFMDHMMPEMDGIETMHHIREKVGNYYQTVPIIALTANAAPGNREMFLEEGFNDFLAKPVEVSILERVLKRNLPEDKILYQTKKEENTPIKTTIEKNQQISQQELEKTQQEELSIADLDIKKGLLYCGSKKAYLDILEECCLESSEFSDLLETLYQKQDWKNYTIKIHALKSTLLSIGATALSEKAKALEQAGKKETLDYILQNHHDMLIEYYRFIKTLSEHPLIQPRLSETIQNQIKLLGEEQKVQIKLQQADLDLKELSEELFDKFLTNLENAMYSLDGEEMLRILSEMQKYQYYQTPLEEKLSPVKKKVEMSDYMSAIDTISHIRDNLKEKKE